MAKKKEGSGAGFSDKQALTLALQEMNEGLPEGTYANIVQNLMSSPQPAMQPADWAQRLSQLSMPAAPNQGMADQDWADAQAFQQRQDQAQMDQDRRLAQVFGLPGPTGQLDTANLPPSVDRYIEKILA